MSFGSFIRYGSWYDLDLLRIPASHPGAIQNFMFTRSRDFLQSMHMRLDFRVGVIIQFMFNVTTLRQKNVIII